MKTAAYIFFLSFLSCHLYSQKQDNVWVFGDSSGMDFSGGNPVPIITSLNTNECTASLADKSGNLLFYCGGTYPVDSLRIWDRNNNLMPNGSYILGYPSATQGALIVPFPSDSNKYYLFTIFPLTFGFSPNLLYSIIDMNLNSGLGDIINKNTVLSNLYFTEKLQLVKHGNGRDWWLIAHQYNTDNFVTYLIDTFGINGPYLQNTNSGWGNSDAIGQMIMSRSGDRLAISGGHGAINIYNFNRCTGQLDSLINLSQPQNFGGFYGCAFSPNGQILYISRIVDSLYQYDLTASNIYASKNLLLTCPTNCNNGQLLLAPDNKIYMATYCGGPLPNNVFTTQNMNLTVINNPDVYGAGCNIAPYSFNLGGKRTYLGLSNMQNYNLGRWVGSLCDTLTTGIKENEKKNSFKAKLYPNPTSGIVNYEYSMEKNNTGKIIISTMWGQELKNIPLTEGVNTLTLDCSNFADGVYMYQIVVNNKTIARDKLNIIK